MFDDFRFGRKTRIAHAGQLGEFDFIDQMIAAHQREHEVRFSIGVLAHQRDRFDRAREFDPEQRRDVIAGFLRRRIDLAHRFRRGGTPAWCNGLGGFHVRCVIRNVGKCNRVLARIGQHVKFLRGIATDFAAVGLHRAESQSKSGEDAAVGVVHVAIFADQILVAEVERIGVLHQELACTHDPKARADLVAELDLDLVEIDRQLLVRLQFVAREIGDRFLGGRPVAVFGLLAILDLQQQVAVLLPAAAFLPQFARLHRRHQQFDRTGTIHFLAHDGLDLAQYAQAQWRPGVDAGGELADHARAQHQPMAGDLGIGGDFTAGIEMELREAHA